MNAVRVRALVGRNVRRLRTSGAVTHEDLALAAQARGLNRPVRWFADLERGVRPVSAEELVALPVVLGEALGYAVGLADLLLGEEPIRFAAGPVAVLPATFRQVLNAPAQRRAFATPDATGAFVVEPSAFIQAAGRMRQVKDAGFGDVDVRVLALVEQGAGERERRLARRLGVPPVVVAAACAMLWQRSLTEERAARLEAPDAPSPTAVMRRLTEDLVQALA